MEVVVGMTPWCGPRLVASTSGSGVVGENTGELHYDLSNRLRISASEAVADVDEIMVDEQGHDVVYQGAPILDQVLPEVIIAEILSRLPDARDLVACFYVSKTIRYAASHARAVRFLCRDKNARKIEGDDLGLEVMPFKDRVIGTLAQLKAVEQLRLEIPDRMQAEKYKGEIRNNSLWLSDTHFVSQWVQPVRNTLQSLCIVDYGQQAIFNPSKLLQVLSTNCKNLRTLELRNMFLDCSESVLMQNVTNLTLRCVKLKDHGFGDINKAMPALQFLTLVNVVGLKEASFDSIHLKVLCLGLATRVQSLRLKVPNLCKLQLKMSCPNVLKVEAASLQCLAVSLDKHHNSVVDFIAVRRLKELLLGCSEFSTLSSLITANCSLEKAFLDVPCLQFEENGRWKRVIEQNVPLALPNIEAMRTRCVQLRTLSIGPGFWHTLEKNYVKGLSSVSSTDVPTWPTLNRLIIHMIVQDTKTSLGLLEKLVKGIPTLCVLEMYIHTDSEISPNTFAELCNQFTHNISKFTWNSWTKGLRFDCFSF